MGTVCTRVVLGPNIETPGKVSCLHEAHSTHQFDKEAVKRSNSKLYNETPEKKSAGPWSQGGVAPIPGRRWSGLMSHMQDRASPALSALDTLERSRSFSFTESGNTKSPLLRTTSLTKLSTSTRSRQEIKDQSWCPRCNKQLESYCRCKPEDWNPPPGPKKVVKKTTHFIPPRSHTQLSEENR
mmetsp:Transcript_15218/g.23708  ORF Transcript_15218/g.23708 Transcript_15218/m.23708 type:complete len:183 (-) Transcript_15218:483-1031(-)